MKQEIIETTISCIDLVATILYFFTILNSQNLWKFYHNLLYNCYASAFEQDLKNLECRRGSRCRNFVTVFSADCVAAPGIVSCAKKNILFIPRCFRLIQQRCSNWNILIKDKMFEISKITSRKGTCRIIFLKLPIYFIPIW